MMDLKRGIAAFAAAALAAAVTASVPPAAPSRKAEPPRQTFPEIFPKPPAEAVKGLARTTGQAFSAGFVFVGGKYMKPPYRIERYGNVLRINGVQITGEIVPWSDFAKTQRGAKAVKVEAPAAPQEEPQPDPESFAYDVYDYSDDDFESSLDDLFDDEPASKRGKDKSKKRAAAKPKTPPPAVTYTFDGVFTTNETVNAYRDSINAERTRIDRLLRSGGFICTGAGYQMVSGDSGAAKHLLDKLPEVMKRNPTREAFGAAALAAGFKYMPPRLLDDLFRNRVDYALLVARLKEMQEEKRWSNLLKGRE